MQAGINRCSESARGAAPGARTIRVAGCIFVLALLVRVGYLLDSADYPAFSVPIFDAGEYDQSARQWIAGDGMGTRFFWQPFFYPFFLALAYAGTGGSVVAVKVLQVVLGAMTCALTCGLGQRLFNRATGVLAGAIVAFYGPLIFYEAELLAAGWATLWAVALLLLLLAVQRRPGFWLCLAVGAVGGLSVITRPTFLPFLLGAGVWLAVTLYRASVNWSDRLRWCLATALGTALVTVPVAAQNARVTGHFGVLPACGGINLYLGNHPEPSKVATAVGFEWRRIQRRPEAEGIVDGYAKQRYFYGQTWDYLCADPVSLARRLTDKAIQFISSRELPRSVNVYTVRQWSGLQSVLTWQAAGFGFPFGLLLPLAAVGVIHHWRSVPVPVALFLVLYPLAIVVVFVTARYRIPIVPPLAILAAAGVMTLVTQLRNRQWPRLLLATAVMAATIVAGSVPGPFPLEYEDQQTGLNLGLALSYKAAGDMNKAVEYFRRELAENPDSVPAHTELGNWFSKQGNRAEALHQYELARAALPEAAGTHANCAVALLRSGRPAEAAAAFRAAIEREPNVARHHAGLGIALSTQGKLPEALVAQRRAVELDPLNAAELMNFGVTLARLGDVNRAALAFRAALTLDPDDTATRFMYAKALDDSGQVQAAIPEYRAVLHAEPGHADARRRLDAALQRPGAR